jgi:hypothetical protein
MDKCVTCGRELHPERAEKYNYCMSRECQEKNLKGLTMVAVGVNKSAEQYLILDENTREELASGKYRDQRREFYGTRAPSPDPAKAPDEAPDGAKAKPPDEAQAPAEAKAPAQSPARPRPKPTLRTATRPAWTRSQERLALLYNEQGLRPDEIAKKLGLTPYQVAQIILNTRSRGKL